ncbi:MAG TPA: DUF177 domain-containing protein [Acidimicrobiales bacterium]|nr:DUF177 domain-containing protein [Acidimicrobiales bacterium]
MTRSPWLVPVTAIRRTPGARQAEHRTGAIGELVVAGSRVPADAEASADVVLDVIDGGIEVGGRVAAPWVGECRRCLRPVTGCLDVAVRELYRPHAREVGGDADEETYPLAGELLDLAPMVRDALLLELPLAPLCSDDCAGLCPTCGALLADGPCGCDHRPADPRWSALDALGDPDGV